MQRFAADGVWRVLYYEGLIEKAMYRTLLATCGSEERVEFVLIAK